MCIPRVLSVKRVDEKRAVMENGQVVDIRKIKKVVPGDRLEVYGPLALKKTRRKS